ncbi:hypothetical protein BZG02_13860 [Labilibaculum filiforme]|uniref:Uncharacterized protein n=1 Tax=Labilibaculum filiforme TaxID=1940526 RepID=A0A2N3HVG9_9BACT|nr:hypothetical protein BZG02_13860 [Labilibaculum filiforme]
MQTTYIFILIIVVDVFPRVKIQEIKLNYLFLVLKPLTGFKELFAFVQDCFLGLKWFVLFLLAL